MNISLMKIPHINFSTIIIEFLPLEISTKSKNLKMSEMKKKITYHFNMTFQLSYQNYLYQVSKWISHYQSFFSRDK